MKILVVSDTHYYNDYLENITNRYKDKVDLMIHCGDSSLKPDSPYLDGYLCVLGNHDDEDFPRYITYKNILVTHGQFYNVYLGYDELIKLCKETGSTICFHGHTHIPTHQVHEGIHFINPGSVMINRGSYGFGTFAIVDIDDNTGELEVHYYHHETFEQVDYVIQEGFDLLDEFKELLTENE